VERIVMRSLFVKIFLWFWLANVLVVGALVLTTFGTPYGPDRERMRAVGRRLITIDGEQAVAAMEQGGLPALRRQIDELHRQTGAQLFLYDENGREFLSQSAPSGAQELALQAAQGGETERNGLASLPSLVAQRVHGSQGRTYVAVVHLSPGPLAEMFAAPRVFALRLIAVLLMAGVVCYGLARYLAGPLRRLRASTRQVAGGDLTVRIGAAIGNRHDEMGDLGRDFDFMVERIDSLISVQRRLLRDMSHELRSPLARLNVALGLARQRAGPDAAVPLDRIEREAKRLNELIGRILTLARLENTREAAKKATIDLTDLVHQVAADAEFEAGSHNRSVCLTARGVCLVVGSPDLLESTIENVVRNAIRYTAEGSTVEITLDREPGRDDDHAVLRVRDYGPGVPEDSLADIFRPFYRVADARERQTGGTGLGLAIAQRTVMLHGGTISAANAPDGGLVVEILLPLARQ
jgi:signal transduction histidine kinase